MAEGEVRQYFVRNEKGTVWGPLTLSTIELLIDNGAIQGRLQVSEDGLNFAFPGRFPHLRDAFPRELWGDVVAAGETVPVAKMELPAEMSGETAPVQPPGMAAPSGAAPMAGPGAVAQAAAPRAGPGAVAQATAPRPGPGATAQAPMPGPGAAARGAVPMAGPGAAVPPGAPRPGPGAPAQAASPMAGPGARPAAPPPGAMPPNPSGTFRSVGPPAAAARPPPVMAPAGAAPVVPAAPAAPPASAAPRPAVPSGSHAAVAPPPATAASAPRPAGPPSTTSQPAVTPASPATPAPVAPEALAPPPAQGSLEQHSPIHLYGRIAAGTHTGLLTLTLSDRSVQIHFRKGSPEFVDSSHAEDALGTVLIQARLLSAEQLQQAEAGRERFGGDLLTALFGLGLLQPASAFSQLSQRALSILHKGLRAESGTFTYEPKELPAAKAMPLGNRWAVLSDQVRRIPSVDLKRRLQPVLNLPIMKAGGMVPASDLRLTPHEVRVLTVIDGVRSIAQLLADLPQDTEHILRLAFLLKELEAVSFAAVATRAPEAKASNPPPAAAAAAKPAAPNPPPAAAAAARPATPHPPPAAAAKPAAPNPPPAAAARPAAPPPSPAAAAKPAAAPAPRPAAPAPAAAAPAAVASKPATPQPSAPATATPASAPGANELPALRQTAATLKGQTHFQRLGLAEQADASAVKIAYFKLAKLYHPDTLPPNAPPELEKLQAEIFGYIGDAYRTLSDEKSRKEYLESLKAGDAGKEEVDVVAILQAEERFKKGTIFMKARKYAEAVQIFEEAIQLNADEAEFYAWRGYARFCAAPDKKAAQPEAFKELQAALKRNERCAPAHYFLGVVAKTVGDNNAALKHFRKTVELQPDHIDAQREIRIATQKK